MGHMDNGEILQQLSACLWGICSSIHETRKVGPNRKTQFPVLIWRTLTKGKGCGYWGGGGEKNKAQLPRQKGFGVCM